MSLSYFFDENLLPIGRAVAAVRRDTTYPGHKKLPSIVLGATDEAWITEAGSLGLLAVTRDRHIRTRPAEKRALVTSGLQAVILTYAGDRTMWENLDLILRAWPLIEALREMPGPWCKGLSGPRSIVDLPIPPS